MALSLDSSLAASASAFGSGSPSLMGSLRKAAYELTPLRRSVQDATTKSQPLRPGRGRM